jgi:hypothetical protein
MNVYGTLLYKAPLSAATQRSTSARPAPDLPRQDGRPLGRTTSRR